MSGTRKVLVALVTGAVVLVLGAGSRFTGGVYASPASTIRGVTIPYPGYLAGSAGQPIADGAYDFRFELYNAANGGRLLWSEAQQDLEMRGGAFAALLGAVVPIPEEALDGQLRWLAISVRGPGEAAFTLLSPRQQLSAEAPMSPASPNAGPSCAHTHFGELWKAGSGAWGLAVENTGTGGGLYGRSAKYVGVQGSSDSHWSGVFDNGILVTDSPWHGIEIDSTAWAGV